MFILGIDKNSEPGYLWFVIYGNAIGYYLSQPV